MPNDRDFRERFAELRRQDQAHAGEFHIFLRRAKPRETPVRLSVLFAVAAGLAVMLAVVVSLPRLERRNIGSPGISITNWKSSTDFLLRTPGLELIRTIPRIGDLPVSTRSPGGRRKSPASRKKSLTKTSLEESLS